MEKELKLFDNEIQENDWKDHYKGMPDYDNVKQEKPEIIATFKFRNSEDFEEFNALLKKHIYIGQKPFDGMQRKESKSTWFPLNEKASNYIYTDES
jgi:hypothetical protein